ncbi:MAG TPA: electron transport complex subunit RsxC [Acidobacteriota bacterium]|nr:electron transport complex subunit RsxC [Acidobacteriota bacterium]
MSSAAHQLHSTTFRHGVHPPQRKDATKRRPIERFPFVEEYVMPLSQHIGAPSVALVRAGDEVKRGQLIAKAGGFVSTTLHAPVSGRVKAVEPRPHPTGKMMPAIVIEADPYSSQRIDPSAAVDPAALSNQEVVQSVQMAGLVGLGGAAFPSHVKLSMQPDRPVRQVVINGCECEPYLTCDARLMAERPEAVLRGTEILMQALSAEQGWVAVEDNKPEAIEALRQAAAAFPRPVEIAGLEVKYPQGAEKMLIEALLGTRVPPGGLPLDIGVLVNNVATTAAMADWFDRGIPLVERVVTVTGEGISRPRNLLVPLGTPVSALVEYCGGLHTDTRQVIMGGPMMGMAQKNLDVPVLKGTSGILAFTEVLPGRDIEYPCIRCGRCLEACPMFLNPTRLAQLARVDAVQELEALHVLDCFECASCSYICPSNIPLVQWIRMGKNMVREAKKRS